MMRYENAELEIVKFTAADIIATSAGTGEGGDDTGNEGGNVGGGGMGGPNEGEEDEL